MMFLLSPGNLRCSVVTSVTFSSKESLPVKKSLSFWVKKKRDPPPPCVLDFFKELF